MNKSFTMKKAFFQINIQDIRGKKKACEICQKDFSVLQKEHQCKRCKRAVCYSCSQNKEMIYRIALFRQQVQDQKRHRQCNLCKEESDRIRQFINTNNIQFGKDTLCERWLKQMNNKKNYEEIIKDYYDNLNDPQFEFRFYNEDASESLSFKKYKDAARNMSNKLADYCDAYNYSYQEFYYHITQKTNSSTIAPSICNIIKAFLNKHPSFGFDDEFILVVKFFLCFASEPLAYMCLSYFYELIYPRELYYTFLKTNDFDIKKYQKLIVSLLDTVFHLQSSDVQKIQSYLRHDFSKMALTLSINSLTFENTYMLIDNCIRQGNFLEFSKGITAICSLRIEDIKKYADISYDKLAVKILRNVEFKELSESLKMFEVVDQRVQEKIIKQFIQEEQKANFILDDKYLQNKILSSDQYKELQCKYEIIIDERDKLRKQLDEQNEVYQLTVTEGQVQKQQLYNLKDELVKAKQELFDYQNLPQNTGTEESKQSNDQSKFISLLQAQIQQLKMKLESLQEELQLALNQSTSKDELLKKLQVDIRENSKLIADLAFENQNIQYELDSNLGRSRTSTRSRQLVETKLSYEMLEEKLKKTQKEFDEIREQYDEKDFKINELQLELIRYKRQCQESEFSQKTLQLTIEVLEQQLKDEKKAHQYDIMINKEKLEIQFKKTYEGLEVAFERNEKLMKENNFFTQQLEEIDQICQDQKKTIKLLQEEYEKQKYLNEEQEKISQEFKSRDLQKQFQIYEELQENEDKKKEELAKSLFKKIDDLVKEIQFRTIDQLLKKQLLTKLQNENDSMKSKIEEHDKAMRILLDKVEAYTDYKKMNTIGSMQVSINLEKPNHKNVQIPLENSIKTKQTSNQINNKQKEECLIM